MHTAQLKAIEDTLKANKKLKADDAKAAPSLVAAAASAGKTVLLAVLPASNVTANTLYDKQTAGINVAGLKAEVDRGAALGTAAVNGRADDGSSPAPPPFLGSQDVGKWRPTPPKNKPGLTPQWGKVKPWNIASPDQFRAPPPPALDSDAYKKSYDEVKAIGNKTSTVRTADQVQR